MYFDNLKHIIPFLIIGGFLLYIIAATISSFLIIVLPLGEDWCLDGDYLQVSEDEYEYVCFEFKNELEEFKYYHNMEMAKRNKYVYIISFLIAYLLTSFCFCFIPKWRNKISKEVFRKNLLISAGVALAITFLGPLLFGFILPPPAEWFPSIFRDMHNEKVDNLLRYINY